MKNKLPNENNNANFLAFNINTGIYNVDKDIQNIPKPMQTTNPKIRCSLDC